MRGDIDMARIGFWALFLAASLVSLVGCGGGSGAAKRASYAQSPGGPMDAVATADTGDDTEIMLEADEAPAPAEPMPPPAAEFSRGAPARQAERPVAKSAPNDARPATPTSPVATGGQPEAKPALASQLLVYTADLTIRVRDVSKAIDAVEQLAKARGGYLVVREDNRITIRVPSAKLDPVLDELTRFGDVVHRNVSVEDVTDLYFDMQTRMKNLEVVKQRLEELLAKAKTVEESLAVQRQLERVTTELETLRGKLKLLGELVLFSTINVEFEPKSSEHLDRTVRLPFPWMDQLGLGSLMRLD